MQFIDFPFETDFGFTGGIYQYLVRPFGARYLVSAKEGSTVLYTSVVDNKEEVWQMIMHTELNAETPVYVKITNTKFKLFPESSISWLTDKQNGVFYAQTNEISITADTMRDLVRAMYEHELSAYYVAHSGSRYFSMREINSLTPYSERKVTLGMYDWESVKSPKYKTIYIKGGMGVKSMGCIILDDMCYTIPTYQLKPTVIQPWLAKLLGVALEKHRTHYVKDEKGFEQEED